MDISFSKHFRRIFSGLPATEQHKIANFISHVKKNAWENLEGRNKKSDDINPASPDYWEKIAFVNQFNLWHYHIGIKYSVCVLFNPCVVITEHNRIATQRIISTNA